ncbi:DUF2889 domain-containing protein [Desulfosarcina ovata]|uniref:DUF2889 domain-containing protein n=1 Tax=Desulfosarcina ovata subsp. ovata TaxID=2752305 RepID=A0A5K8AAX3_9BACT|nr:DUF2889 domain-containing protein [Desulfosarcina ovata]BBO89638.1 hypothetical protein DSCOOX_28180 [Desulfosarcina ovata subsp. ovata]
MIVFDKSRQKVVHNRSIDTVIYEGASGDTIIVEGALQDRRFLDSHHPSGEIRPPYTVHHMIVRLELTVPEMVIKDVEVEMPEFPHPDCIDTLHTLTPLKGMCIAGGFMARIRKLVPRKGGCTHLHELLTAMAPAAFQGAWSYRISNPIDYDTFKMMSRGLKNNCYAWREGGDRAREWIDDEVES